MLDWPVLLMTRVKVECHQLYGTPRPVSVKYAYWDHSNILACCNGSGEVFKLWSLNATALFPTSNLEPVLLYGLSVYLMLGVWCDRLTISDCDLPDGSDG